MAEDRRRTSGSSAKAAQGSTGREGRERSRQVGHFSKTHRGVSETLCRIENCFLNNAGFYKVFRTLLGEFSRNDRPVSTCLDPQSQPREIPVDLHEHVGHLSMGKRVRLSIVRRVCGFREEGGGRKEEQRSLPCKQFNLQLFLKLKKKSFSSPPGVAGRTQRALPALALRVETGRDRSVISRKLTEECPKHFVESCIV